MSQPARPWQAPLQNQYHQSWGIHAYPVSMWTAGITRAKNFALAIAVFLLLYMWQMTPWLVVILSAAGANLLALFPAPML